MKLRFLVVSALAITGCASRATTAHHTAAPTSAPAVLDIAGPAVRSIDASPTAGTGEPREVTVLVDEPALKLVKIVLRGGTALPEHHAEVPVTIQALGGAATVTAGGETVRLDAAHPLVLAAKVPHAVSPDPGTDLVLLIHHLGRAADHHGVKEH